MWIRTQDKLGLFELKGFKIREHVFENGTKEYLVLGNDNLYNHLGTYNSKERALEVLDEISKQLSINKAIEICSNLGDMTQANRENYIYTQVYQMPEV